MKPLEISFRPLMISAVLLLLVVGLAPQSSLAQTVSASPGYLTFAIPTGTSPAVSAAETVTVNITGTAGSIVSFTSFTLSPSSPFAITGNTCLNPATTPANSFTVPATCQISITLTTASTTLVTDTLVASYGGESSLSVPLSGAYGAIKLFDATTVALSAGAASFTTPTTIESSTQNLSCSTTPTGTLSNTPGTVPGGGLGYVLVDNYLVMSVGGNPVSTLVSPEGNVCTGGVQDSFSDPTTGLSVQQDCFSQAYRTAAVENTLLGDNTDALTNPGNNILPSGVAGGVPPIPVASFLSSISTSPVPVSFSLLDAGGYVASSSLFLVTNCSPAGIAPGGSVTGNPTPTNTASFDSNPGADLSITDNTAQNAPTSGTTPIYTQIGVPQQLFYQLVNGTSAAPDVCLRASSELDYSVTPAAPPAPMCVGILIQCWDPTHTTLSGNNCDSSTPVGLRDLYDTVQFASPDGPVNGTNFLFNASTNACSYYLANPNVSGQTTANGACATGTGPTVLMGGDNWLCTPGDYPPNPCTPLEPNSSIPLFNTTTSPSTPIYSELNDALGGGLAGDLSPLGTLTNFQGAADGSGGSSVPLKNSVLLLVANHPLPTATATVAGQNSNGWIKSTTINATFSSAAATYTPGPTNPPSNIFVAAPPYSLTYGISTWPTLPDTTYPVAGDLTNYNSTVNPNLGVNPTPPPSWLPLCPSGPIPATPASFGSAGSFSSLSNGIYNLHYFTTDCALTEGLVFNPTAPQLTNPTANWASFPFVTVGVDTVAPTLTCSTSPSPVYNAWYNTNVTVSCSATDVGSGFAPGTAVANAGNTVLQGGLTATLSGVSTAVGPGSTNPAAIIAAQQISDLAGNLSNTQGPYSFQIDRQVPSITGPALSPTASGNKYVVGSVTTVTITYSCNDGVGSGVAYCTEVGALPLGTTTACTPTPAASGVPVTCTSTFTPAPTNVGSYSIYVGSADNVGNIAMNTAALNFSIADASATVIFGGLPAPAVTPGSNLTYYVGAADTYLGKTPVSIYGATINVALTIPTGTLATGTATAISDDVSCSSWPCSVMPTSGPACTVTPSSVTSTTTAVSISCSVGTIPDIFTSKSAVIVKIVLPTSKTAKAGSIATSGTITATTPLSGTTSFSSSVSIK